MGPDKEKELSAQIDNLTEQVKSRVIRSEMRKVKITGSLEYIESEEQGFGRYIQRFNECPEEVKRVYTVGKGRPGHFQSSRWFNGASPRKDKFYSQSFDWS